MCVCSFRRRVHLDSGRIDRGEEASEARGVVGE